MNLETQFKINNNPMLKKYIKENSYWYKYLNRNPNLINKMNEEMKKKYNLRMEDKLEDLNNKINIISAFMNEWK